MSDGAYSLVWTKEAVVEWQRLPLRQALDIANNVTALVRDPYPAGFAVVVPDEDGLYLLHVGGVSVLYEIVGFTIRVLAVVGRET